MKNVHYREITYEVTFISSDHNYRNSSVIANLAMAQTPRSTKRIFSLLEDRHTSSFVLYNYLAHSTPYTVSIHTSCRL